MWRLRSQTIDGPIDNMIDAIGVLDDHMKAEA